MTTFSVPCLYDQAYSKLITVQTLRWLQHVPPKHQYAPTKLCIHQKTTVLLKTIKKTSKFKIEQAVRIQMCVQVASIFNAERVPTYTDAFSWFWSLIKHIRGPVISNRPQNFFTNLYLLINKSYLRISAFLHFVHALAFWRILKNKMF
jgi:hypothetical protein